MNYLDYNIPPPAKNDFFLNLLTNAWRNDIVTVVCALNDPEWTLGDVSPQRYGRPNNALITVGSMNIDGLPSRKNPPEVATKTGRDPELKGSYTVYAQGEALKIARPWTFSDSGAHNAFEYNSGSSLATPQVSGLIAYLLGLPGQGRVANTAFSAKQLVVYLRRNNDSPDAVGAAYNGVRQLVCPPTRKSRREMRKRSVREKDKVVVARQDVDPDIEEIVFANG